MQGYLSLVLHAHLPFVRHPEYEDFLEEDWLYEAISETYLPLLMVFERLVQDGVRFRLTMSMSPTLVAMLQDGLLVGRYARKLERLLSLADKEVERTRGDSVFHPLALRYQEHFAALHHAYHKRYQRNLVGAFDDLQRKGGLEIITCCATHGFLPLMQATPEAVRAQIKVGAQQHRRTFGRSAAGIWLPECGYYPGVERFLADEGIAYFFVDAHGILDAIPRPLYGMFAPLFTPSGVAAFGRDPESSRQVWSKEVGYPGDPLYREFYRDIGWDLELDYVRPYVQPTGERKNTGIKYYRITGNTEEKDPYDFDAAARRAREHAGDFLQSRVRQAENLYAKMHGRRPIIVAPYDAELFGHWWFEGPHFLDALLRKSAEQDVCRLATPSDYLADHPENQLATPAASSWGEKGHAEMWLDGSNDWIYPHLHRCARGMARLARDFPRVDALRTRALNQAARELLLAQSSDWAFIMKTGTMVDYAVKRTREHVLRFLKLERQIREATVEDPWLSSVEQRDNVFPDIDYRIYAG